MQLAALRFRRTASTRPTAPSWAAVCVVAWLGGMAAVNAEPWLERSDAWRIRWTRPVAAGAAPDRRSSIAVDPSLAAGVVVWNAGSAIHGVMVDSGLPAWRESPIAGTAVFPRGRGVARQPLVPSAMSVAGHLVYAVIDPYGDGPLLVCLDCSATAEGRLLWSAAPPSGTTWFDGPPAADHELCTIVARSADGRGAVHVVAYDARDGVVVWRRSLGAPVARDGLDHGRGIRRPLLHDDLVIVADHAGSVSAWSRSGRQAWRYDYDVPIRRAGTPAGDADILPADGAAVAAGGRAFVAPLDRGGVIALACAARAAADDASVPQSLLWETPSGGRVRLVGATVEQVVFESTAGADRGRLTCVAAADGGPLVASDPDSSVAGPAVLAGGAILRPVRDRGAGPLSVAVLSSETLRPRGKAFPLATATAAAVSPDDETPVRMAAGRSGLVVAASGMLFCLGADTP